jgi:erythronate-4-phosphate dehydrogenase
MKVLANRYLYKFREIMPENVQVDFFDPKHLPDNSTEYDALFVNTTTPLNEKTLPEPGNISFVATGSSGTDHLDQEYLSAQNIKVADANGCNAVTVAEYVITVLLTTLDKKELEPFNLTAGIIGVGAVGTEVHKLLSGFSIQCVLFDPPRAERESTFDSAYFGELKDCDLLTFHTPLTNSGQYPTRQMFNKSWLGETSYKLLINSSRGGVIDETAALKMMSNGNLDNLVIDTWEGEPEFNPTVAKSTRFATPHIAGYSIQSKRRATEMIVNLFCEHVGIESPISESSEPFVPELKDSYDSLSDILLELHPLGWFDQQMRNLCALDKSNRAESFSLLRSESPLRHEYSNIRIKSHHLSKFPQLEKLGIKAL